MKENSGSLGCQANCWGVAIVAGLLAAVIMIVVGDVSVTGSIFVGIILAAGVGVLLSWFLCRPLPSLDEVRARGPISAGTGRSAPSPSASAPPSAASPNAPAPSAPAAPTVSAEAGAASAGGGASAMTFTPESTAPIGAAAAADERAQNLGSGSEAPAPIGAAAVADDAVSATGTAEAEESAGTKPPTLDGPRDGGADNLKEIKGVGPKLEKMLNGMGIYHFDQVASWGASELAWVDANLEGFKGRASRDDWVSQAKILASGGDTEFSKRVDEGGVY